MFEQIGDSPKNNTDEFRKTNNNRARQETVIKGSFVKFSPPSGFLCTLPFFPAKIKNSLGFRTVCPLLAPIFGV
jgi:hypothetical protein